MSVRVMACAAGSCSCCNRLSTAVSGSRSVPKRESSCGRLLPSWADSCSVLSSSAAVLFLPFRCRFRGVTVCAHRGTEA